MILCDTTQFLARGTPQRPLSQSSITPTQPISLDSGVILSSNFLLNVPSGYFPRGFAHMTVIFCVFMSRYTFTLPRVVRSDVLIAVIMKITVFWNVKPCSLVQVCWTSRGNLLPPSLWYRKRSGDNYDTHRNPYRSLVSEPETYKLENACTDGRGLFQQFIEKVGVAVWTGFTYTAQVTDQWWLLWTR
jgi:hypothetical protein